MTNLYPNLDILTPQLISLAQEAGQLISHLYPKEIAVMEKPDGSSFTQADLESHRFLKKGLEKQTPSIPVVSEEDEASWKEESPLFWLIDPLDGTKGFILKTGEFCVNIALVYKNKPIFGLIHIPLTQETLYGYEGKAKRSFKGKISSLHTRPFPAEGGTLLLGGYGKKFQEQEDIFIKSYPIAKVERIRSALKFCSIAKGEADLYVRFETCGEWDTAAGHALVEAAGGLMRNLDGTPFVYGKPGLLNKGFVVFGRKP